MPGSEGVSGDHAGDGAGGSPGGGPVSRDRPGPGGVGPGGVGPGGVGPGGEVYEWYRRGKALLDGGNANAAVQVLGHAVAAEPGSRSAREALARAQFDSGQYLDARDSFAWIVAHDPADDYAQYGLGLAARRTGDLRSAVEHLALAVAMRPDLSHYTQALRGARAALAAS